MPECKHAGPPTVFVAAWDLMLGRGEKRGKEGRVGGWGERGYSRGRSESFTRVEWVKERG